VERNFCLLIILACSLFASESYWFSYKIVTQDSMMVFEEKNISPQMQIIDKNDYEHLCRVDDRRKMYESEEHFLNRNFDKLLTCFYPFSSTVVNETLVETKGVIERTQLTIIPIKFTVDFKDDFANINTLK